MCEGVRGGDQRRCEVSLMKSRGLDRWWRRKTRRGEAVVSASRA